MTYAGARLPYRSETILGRGHALSTDTVETGLNNNMLVIGPSGAGKTRHMLKPNLLQMGSSFITLDTKGTLAREVGPALARSGYDVMYLNFTDLADDATALPSCVRRIGYNPLAFIRTTAGEGRVIPNQQDVISVARALCPVENGHEPFWDYAASNLIACLIAYVMEELPRSERNFGSVIALAEHLEDMAAFKLIDDLEATHPGSMALSLYKRYAGTLGADKMSSSINGIVAEKLMCLGIDSAIELYRSPFQVDVAGLGSRKAALFVAVDDLDRSLDPLTSLFVGQAIKELIRAADRQPRRRLSVPVRLMLDDFANLNIENIDSVLAIARSREVWITLLLQSYDQLEAIYGRARAMSIMGNCDTHVVLAFQDLDTARCYAERANKMATTLLETPRGRWWLFVRGARAKQVDAYRLEDHPRYGLLGEVPEERRTHDAGDSVDGLVGDIQI